MTREIKFRGKKIDTGEWVYGNYAFSSVNGKHQITVETLDGCKHYYVYHPVNPETVGQYTGLKDKNGKEIYEGDIATIAWHPEEPLKKIKNLWVVRYSGWQFSAEPNRETLKPYGATLAETLEVIGNIHDNPELLKEST